MNETMKLILSLSLSGSILAVLIFIIKPLIKYKLSKTIQYYIWIVVLLRLIIPFSFEGSIMNNVFYHHSTTIEKSTQGTVLPITGIEGNPSNSSTDSILPNVSENVAKGVYNGDADHSRYFRDLFNQYVLSLWLLGIIIALTVNLISYARFSKSLRQTNKPATEEQNIILTGLLHPKGQDKVRLVRNRFVSTPMLIGILKPWIIIPDSNFHEEQLKYMLLHELVHLRRFDLAIKWLTMIVASIHWFNPLMYFLKKEINHACELACDEAVIQNLNQAEKQAYGDTLISVVAEQRYPLGVLQATMCEEKKSLKERLITIMNHTKKSKRVIAFSVLLLGFVIFCAIYLGAGVGIGKDTPPNIYTPDTNIDVLLAQIMSSPKESSKPGDYIATHKVEYDAIIKMDIKALPYLFSEFEKGGQTGLKGHILESLCRKILDGEDIKYASQNPQDWYDHYKAHLRSIAGKNSPDFVKKNYPKGSLVLAGVELNVNYEIVNFADEQVEIAGRKLNYKAADLAPLYEKIGSAQVEKMMYRAVTFYEAAFTHDYDTINRLVNQQLKDELQRWADNRSKQEDNSAMPIMKLDNYTDVAFPTGIIAPKPTLVESDQYLVVLEIAKDTQVQMSFEIGKEGNPLVASFSLIQAGRVQK